jgi:hypothetical protein
LRSALDIGSDFTAGIYLGRQTWCSPVAGRLSLSTVVFGTNTIVRWAGADRKLDAFEREPGKWRAKFSRFSWPLKPSRREPFRLQPHYQKNSGIEAGHQRRNAPTLDDRSIPAAQSANQNRIVTNKKPRIRHGAKSRAVLTICKPTHKGVPLAAPARRIGNILSQTGLAKKSPA